MRIPIFAISLLVLFGSAVAGQQFDCDGARVDVTVSAQGSRMRMDNARSTVSVSRERSVRELSYIGGIEFVGAHCTRASDGRLLVLFQAYCGGSGCKDLDNWGVVDPRSLQVLLAPNDFNRGDAQRILGLAPLAPSQLLSVERDVNAGRKNLP